MLMFLLLPIDRSLSLLTLATHNLSQHYTNHPT